MSRKHDVDCTLGELPQRVGAGARGEDFLADAGVGAQQVHELVERRLLVVGDEDVDHARTSAVGRVVQRL